MSVTMTLADVASAIGGVLVGGDPEATIAGVSTDSRDVGPAQLFFAIPGETFDGHDYAAAAVDAGAGAVVVERGRADGVVPRVEVDDPLRALRDLAVAWRDRLEMPVIAVTGSTGKTTTKDFLAAALPGAHAAMASYNNEIGVPLTVLSCPPDATYLVVEVGSRGPGHIAYLGPAVRPDVAIITNLGVVHLETFGSTEVLADSKWELVEALRPGGTAVLPADEPRLDRVHQGHTLTFGGPGADVAVEHLELDRLGRPRFTLAARHRTRQVAIDVPGAHQAGNVAAAVAAGLAVGADLDVMVERLGAARPSRWRMEIHPGRFTVVNDAYNANPQSVRAALEAVAAMEGKRRVAFLGMMAELGAVEAEMHVAIGRLAANLGFELVIVGEDPGYARGFGPAARHVTDGDAATDLARDLLQPGDLVLVKASRSVGLEQLAARLVSLAEDPEGDAA